jgi:predicted deacylase
VTGVREGFHINGQTIRPGEQALVDLPLPRLNSHSRLSMPVHVIHGRREGPRLFLSAAVHGDELNGVEIIRRLLNHRSLERLHGTLVAVPVVNVYGVIHESRYLPDRRDLNRSFPGSAEGSLTARVAYLLMEEIVSRCSHGVDLHTGAHHRTNLPQIRANLDDPETERLARAFGVPVLLNASLRDGSLREAAAARGIPMLLYEAGEALRFDELSIRVGVHGVLGVMRELGMLRTRGRRPAGRSEPFVARTSTWARAHESGMLRTIAPLGARVRKGEALGFVDDPYTGTEHPIRAHVRGVVIGRTNLPIVHEGDAVFHIARFRDDVDEVADQVESFHQTYADDMEGEEPAIV